MSISKLFKKYFFDNKKIIILNFVILVFCTIFVIFSNYLSNIKKTSDTKVLISDFPPVLLDAFNSNLYGLVIENYTSTINKPKELRQITLGWKTSNKDLQKVELLKKRIVEISDRYLILANKQINNLTRDFEQCLLYLYKNQAYLPEEIIEIEAQINYVVWFKKNLEKLIEIEKSEIKFTNINNIIEVTFSSLFLSFLFIILINFVRIQKKNL